MRLGVGQIVVGLTIQSIARRDVSFFASFVRIFRLADFVFLFTCTSHFLFRRIQRKDGLQWFVVAGIGVPRPRAARRRRSAVVRHGLHGSSLLILIVLVKKIDDRYCRAGQHCADNSAKEKLVDIYVVSLVSARRVSRGANRIDKRSWHNVSAKSELSCSLRSFSKLFLPSFLPSFSA